MHDLLPLSVGIGLTYGLLATEILGIATGGLIVPGYFALHLMNPIHLLMTLAAAFLAYGSVKVLDGFAIVFGRRRIAAMILVGYAVGTLLHQWSGMLGEEYRVIGFVIPGLLAIWMDRQGIVETLAALTIVSVAVRLTLVLVVGMEVAS